MQTPLQSVAWIHGAANCATTTDPLIQVHQFDQQTFVLRLSKCFSYEGNFLYLLFGRSKAILFDTGGPPGRDNPGAILPIRATVDSIVARWQQDNGVDAIELVVAHTHSHQDHCFWDHQFDARPRTTVVRPTVDAVKVFFGMPNWPDGQTVLDLGDRHLTVFPVPGHESAHIAVYDDRTKALLTGDMLYPGLLTVADWAAYRRSASRLADFAGQHEVSLVLGNHIEMKKTPRELYAIGTTFQPDEHVLPLTAAHIVELHHACEAMANAPHYDIHDDFIIDAQ
jgi:hydroxyacylglutathione hydrolase